ncbi:hypothetical protein AC1031_011391 [Aphanomyces cochlioides]|nr:hypothetical protein AC1031_011391 [Aphanomyces cochlioides]
MLQRVQDLVPHIASFIEAPDDFFSFLEAVGPPDIPVALKCIWQLGLQMDRSDLWPLLHIDTSMDIPFEAQEPCMTYYSIIHIEETDNLERLKKHLDSKTEVHWTLSEWTTLRWIDFKLFFVRRLCIDIDCRADDEKMLLDVLTELLVHLKALVLCLIYHLYNLEKVLALVADSKQLIELECWKVACRGLKFCIRDTMAHDILKWFNKQPVRVFRVNRGSFKLMNKACDKSFSTQYLIVQRWIHLHWASEYNTGTQQLFEVLPHTLIRTLEISSTKLNFSEWQLLAQFLPSCRLESLTLRNCELTNQYVISIAQAIKNNCTITELDLSSNRFEFNAARTLIEFTTDPNRFVHMKLIALGGNFITRQQIEVLKVLAVQHCIQTLQTEDESDDGSYSEVYDDSDDEDDRSEDNDDSDDETNHRSSKDESCSEDNDDSDDEDDRSEDSDESYSEDNDC